MKERPNRCQTCKDLAIRVEQLTQIFLLNISGKVSDKGHFNLEITERRIEVTATFLKVIKLNIHKHIDYEP